MSPSASDNLADTIRILISTDNHVGFNERDDIRGEDSWRTFDEVMMLAKERDVDMVLLAGDLFHDNKPSRRAMYNVMRSLRANCYGDKPCELQMLSDASENFDGAFNYVNYEDPDINIAIPVFSIHGNHDDPSGEGHLAALDILQQAGLVNYYGRTPESDNIHVKPVLLQKGRTKLALYGLSNVRDERLYRTFRDGRVKFYQPQTQKENWFNLMSVHQNHHAYTDTGYLPENFLPDFMDLVVWGHEHECLIDPRLNPEMGFYVMQPGSSVATSLVPGETVTKQVSLLSVTGKQFESESITLKSVRPFVMKEIVLQNEPGMKALSKKSNNRTEISRHLSGIVDDLIQEANTSWLESNGFNGTETDLEPPLPIVRLRVDYTPPEGGEFHCENPQRFCERFKVRQTDKNAPDIWRVANKNDVIQYHRKKKAVKRMADNAEMPEEGVLNALSLDTVKVEKLVKEFLRAQSLTILPQNSFGDAVSQFVDKDDKHAMEMFVGESLTSQVKHLLAIDGNTDEEDITAAMGDHRSKLEELFAAGHMNKNRKAKLKPRPDNWDSDIDGDWEDQPGAIVVDDNSDGGQSGNGNDDVEEGLAPQSSRGRGRARGVRGSGATRASARAAATSKRTPAAPSRSRRRINASEEEGHQQQETHNEDVIMIDDDDDDDPAPPSKSTSNPSKNGASLRNSSSATRQTSSRTGGSSRPAARQTQLNFSQQNQPRVTAPARRAPLAQSDDEISDDDDAFETATAPSTRSRRR